MRGESRELRTARGHKNMGLHFTPEEFEADGLTAASGRRLEAVLGDFCELVDRVVKRMERSVPGRFRKPPSASLATSRRLNPPVVSRYSVHSFG